MEIQLWREILHPYEQAVSEIIVKFVCNKSSFNTWDFVFGLINIFFNEAAHTVIGNVARIAFH